MTKAQAYIRSIRNDFKRVYAEVYWEWLNSAQTEPEPVWAAGLSYMAAQSVRISLQNIKDRKSTRKGATKV